MRHDSHYPRPDAETVLMEERVAVVDLTPSAPPLLPPPPRANDFEYVIMVPASAAPTFYPRPTDMHADDAPSPAAAPAYAHVETQVAPDEEWEEQVEEWHENELGQLTLHEVGEFHDLYARLPAVPAETVYDVLSAMHRLCVLKMRLNELQRMRRGYWLRQGGTLGLGMGAAWATVGLSVVVASMSGLHQRNRIAQIKRAMRGVIVQINRLRVAFGTHPDWALAELRVVIDERVFTRGGISRNELAGDL